MNYCWDEWDTLFSLCLNLSARSIKFCPKMSEEGAGPFYTCTSYLYVDSTIGLVCCAFHRLIHYTQPIDMVTVGRFYYSKIIDSES